jgi:hypothetical protein
MIEVSAIRHGDRDPPGCGQPQHRRQFRVLKDLAIVRQLYPLHRRRLIQKPGEHLRGEAARDDRLSDRTGCRRA